MSYIVFIGLLEDIFGDFDGEYCIFANKKRLIGCSILNNKKRAENSSPLVLLTYIVSSVKTGPIDKLCFRPQ